MSHAAALAYLSQSGFQKISYEIFTFGHVALAVQAPVTESPKLKRTFPHKPSLHLLQIAIHQATNVDSDLSYLQDKHWILYRPTRELNQVRLRDFVSTVLKKAHHPQKAYHYLGAIGLYNVNTSPKVLHEISDQYTCITLIQAALHYAGHPVQASPRRGFFDILTPAQLVRAKRKESGT